MQKKRIYLVPEVDLHQQVFGEEIKYSKCREKHLSLIRSLLVSSCSNVGSFETLAAIKEKIYRSSTKTERNNKVW